MARKPRKASRTEWHQHKGLWSRSLGNRGMRLRLFEKRSGGGFYRSVWIPGQGFSRKSLGTTERNEADKLGRALLAALLRNENVTASGALMLGDLWARYKRDAVTFLDNHEKTRLDDSGRATVLLGYFGEDCEVCKLTEADQSAFIKKRLAGGIKHGKDKSGKDKLTKPVRSRSSEADLKLLHSMLNWARTVRVHGGNRLLEQNPLDGIRKPHEKNPRRPVATFERFQATRTAIQQLAEESKTDPERRKWLRLELALVIAEATGRRLGSIRQLGWPDIDFSGETIRWRADTDKKGKAWAIPLTPALRDELKLFRLKLGGAFGGLVFPSESDANEPIRSDVFAKWLLAAEERAGLPKLAGSLWHAYRRSWATARKHLPAADVAAAGGWSDLTTLLRCYQQVDDATLLSVMNEPRKVMERVSNA
jgi:integrase